MKNSNFMKKLGVIALALMMILPAFVFPTSAAAADDTIWSEDYKLVQKLDDFPFTQNDAQKGLWYRRAKTALSLISDNGKNVLNYNAATLDAAETWSLFFYAAKPADQAEVYGKTFTQTNRISINKIGDLDAVDVGVYNQNSNYMHAFCLKKSSDGKGVDMLVRTNKTADSAANVEKMTGTVIATLNLGEYYDISVVYDWGNGTDPSTATAKVYLDGELIYTWEGGYKFGNNNSNCVVKGTHFGAAYVKTWLYSRELSFNWESVALYRSATPRELATDNVKALNEIKDYVKGFEMSDAVKAKVATTISTYKAKLYEGKDTIANIKTAAKAALDADALAEYKTYAASYVDKYIDPSVFDEAVSNAIKGYISDAKTAISGATSIAAAKTAVANVTAKIDTDVLPLSKTSFKADVAKAAKDLEGIYDSDKKAINDAVAAANTAIDACTTIEAAKEAKNAAVASISKLVLDAKVLVACDEIENYVDLDKYTDDQKKALKKSIGTNQDALLELTDAGDIAAILKDAKTELDDLMKEFDAQNTTAAPETEAPAAEETTAAEKSGCGSYAAVSALAATMSLAVASIITKKRRTR